MRVPTRKPGKYTNKILDPYITKEKYDALVSELHKLKKVRRPKASIEMQRAAEMGDFSENAEYQAAKRKLRGINSRILEIEAQLNHAHIIDSESTHDHVRIGSTVTIINEQTQKTYTILGSTESNPSTGVISHNSPIGKALLGKKVGDEVIISLPKGDVMYHIAEIS